MSSKNNAVPSSSINDPGSQYPESPELYIQEDHPPEIEREHDDCALASETN